MCVKMANLSRHSEGAHESVCVFGALLAASHSGAGLLGSRLYVMLAVLDAYAVASTALQLPVAEEPTVANINPVFPRQSHILTKPHCSTSFHELLLVRL